MEATAIIRNSVESWRSGAIRWFLGRFGDHAEQQAGPLDLSGDRIQLRGNRSNPWQDAFWSSHAPATSLRSRKAAVLWHEQAELWPAANAPAHQARTEFARLAPRAGTSRAVLAVADDDSQDAAVPSRMDLAPKRRAKRVRTADMARLLQVTGSVDGIVTVQRFDLPRNRFLAHVSQALWKERSIGTPFVTGC